MTRGNHIGAAIIQQCNSEIFGLDHALSHEYTHTNIFVRLKCTHIHTLMACRSVDLACTPGHFRGKKRSWKIISTFVHRMRCKEHLWNFCLLRRVHLSYLVTEHTSLYRNSDSIHLSAMEQCVWRSA